MDSIFIGNRDGDTTKCSKCGAEYYAAREFHTCPVKKKSGPKKGKKAANEAIAHELRQQAKAIMERAILECRDLGVKVYFDDAPGYGYAGCHLEIANDDYFDFVVDIRKAKSLRKLVEGAYQFS